MNPANPLIALEDRVPALARISDYVNHYARRCPDRVGARLDGFSLGFGDLDEAVNAAARALVASGVRRGDRVAMLATPSPEFLTVFLATASIGAVWLGLNPKYKPREFEHVIADARPRLLLARGRIAGRDYTDELPTIASNHGVPLISYCSEGIEGAGRWEAQVAVGGALTEAELAAIRAAVRPEDPCLLVYTSGSTGRSKGALLTHRGLVKGACRRAAAWWHGPFRTLANLPVNHIGGVGDVACTTLVTGGMLSFMEHFDADAAIEITRRDGLTFWYQIPTQLQMIAERPAFAQADLGSLRAVIWSGAAAPADLIRTLAGRFPGRLGTDYSMTESIGAVTMTPLTGDLDVLANSVGWPDPRREVRLGEDGEILVRDDACMAGYLHNPEATAVALDSDGWLHTNDVGEWRPDGSVAIIGRLTDMFKSGGYNVYPREIEQVLESHPDVVQAAVAAAPHPTFGEVGYAFVTLRAGSPLDEGELVEWCRHWLANYKVPKACAVLPELPLLPVGKVDKQSLRQLASGYRGQ